jgi:hypothetical protein
MSASSVAGGDYLSRESDSSRTVPGDQQASTARNGRHRAELMVALIAALAGGLISIAGSLAGVYRQTTDGDHHMRQSMRHEAVDKFIDEYSIVKVELQHYGDMRIPATGITHDDQAALRKHVHGVEGACARLVLVAPELVGPATNFRKVLIDWGHAISEPRRTAGNIMRASFSGMTRPRPPSSPRPKQLSSSHRRNHARRGDRTASRVLV